MLKTIILFLILPFTLLAQQTKKVVRQKDKYTQKEIYYVLESDTSVKEGEYSLLDGRTGNTRLQGHYHNNQKDGRWTSYDAQKKFRAVGNYQDDLKTGLWSYYNSKGELDQEYDHSKDTLVFINDKETFLNAKTLIIRGGDTLYKTADRIALYIGGRTAITEFLAKNLVYPRQAERNKIEGKVILLITIDEEGKAIDYQVQSRVDEHLEEESLRVARELPQAWKPALLKGKAVKSIYQLTITFKLPE